MRNRSIYLVAKYTGLPKDPKRTHEKGYITNPDNVTYDEQVYITRGLRDQDVKNQVVLNLTEEKIVKNIFRNGEDFNQILEHFVDGYGDYINDCVNKLNEISGH